jgi:hypothetical protein
VYDVNTKYTFCDVLPENSSRLFIRFCVSYEPACLTGIRDDTCFKRLTKANKQLIHGELERWVFGSTFVIAVFVMAREVNYPRFGYRKINLSRGLQTALI